MRQAVVLIHGIGEQKPMGTVRRFVKAVLPGDGTDAPAYRSRPDRMSELFELRVLRSRGRPSTDFYEYYWVCLPEMPYGRIIEVLSAVA